MKKYIYIFIAALLVVSCYEDKSTAITSEYPDIIITPNIAPGNLTCDYGEPLSLSAEAYQEGIPDEKLEFLWEMDLVPEVNKERSFLGDGKSVEFRVVNTPSAKPYNITLTVTNTDTGFSRYVNWRVFVANSLGEGVLVADTHDGGKTYQLDLLSSKYVTYGYVSDNPRVISDLYALGNQDEAITRPVTALLARSYTNFEAVAVSSFNEDVIIVATDSSICALDPAGYKKTMQDEQLFSTKGLTEFGGELLTNGGIYSSFLVMKGRLFVCCDMLDNKYATLSCPDALRGTITKENVCCSYGGQGSLYAYNNANHAFYSIKCWNAYQSSLQAMPESDVPDKAFLADKVAVAAGVIKGQKACFVLKGGDGTYWVVVLSDDISAVTFKMDAADIEKASMFEFCDNADIFYYSDGKTVYSTVLSGANAVTKKLNWAPDSDSETLTMMRQYRQAWYGTHRYSDDYEFPLQYHRAQMMMVTWNESAGEGKIYFRPFNVSTGMFSVFNNNGSVGGFGRISAIGTTMR